MKALDKLAGIIEGINSDGVINNKEVLQLQSWVDDNYELHDDPICKGIFNTLEDALEDGIISEPERELLLDFSNDYLIDHNSQMERMNTLKGIIRGIICDNIINDKEIHSLKRWLKKNYFLAGISTFDKIFNVIEKVLEDNKITVEEQEQLFKLFTDFMSAKTPESEEKTLDLSLIDNAVNDKNENALFNYESKINSLLTDESTIYIIKGVANCRALNYCLPKLYEFDLYNVLASEEYNEEQLIQDLLTKIALKKSYVISYEEFVLLPLAIKNILGPYNYKLCIINNNLYHNYYPIIKGVNKKMIMNCLDSDVETLADSIWEDYIVANNRVFLAYQPIETDTSCIVEKIELLEEVSFDDTIQELKSEAVYDFGQTEETYISTLDRIINSEDKAFNILVDNNGLLSYQKRSLSILAGIGYKFILVKRTVKKIVDDNIDSYEIILKRKNPNYKFKLIDFYLEPGISLETQKISQGEIVGALVNNAIGAYKNEDFNDVFVTAPTGAGKSVLFQIPAIYLAEQYELLTIVISPLIGLMNDQIVNIASMTDKAVTINSEYTPEEKEEIKKQIQKGEKSILYISPETLLSNNPISTLIGDRKIGLLVIDEAHIVTTWGKSFRPDYWYLGDYICKLRQSEYSFPIATFSATVTYGGDDDMHGDILDSLKMKTGTYEYVAPMRRDDISFDIRTITKENDYAKEKQTTAVSTLASLITSDNKSLVYFPFVRQIKEYYTNLNDISKDNLHMYYGSLDKSIKKDSMESFVKNTSGMMLATKAFGMGIDVDDINVVYHFAPTGNLCDYVQEIGRAARSEAVNGTAVTDFYEEDFRYINQLYGMSAINDYHLKGVLYKIKDTYYNKKSRNFTISPDDFAHIFASNNNFDDVDNKLKTAVLMIQKDFELNPYINYKPLIFKPRSLFTKGYFLIMPEAMAKLEKTRFKKYFRLYAEKEALEKDVEYKAYAIENGSVVRKSMKHHTSYMGNVYVVDFKRMWEEHFSEYTFANFKRMFYLGELKGIEYTNEFSPKYLLTIKSNNGLFNETKEQLDAINNGLIEQFSKPDIGKKHLTLEEIADILMNVNGINIKAYEKTLIAENFINIVNNYKGAAQFNNVYPIRFNSATGKYIIHSQNALIAVIKKISYSFQKKFNADMSNREKVFLINTNPISNTAKPDTSEEMYMAKYLEAFNLCSYQVVSGERPEYFVRVNSILQIEKILEDQNYRSKMVDMVRNRHFASKETMQRFFMELSTDQERWDYIEKYFVGMEKDAIEDMHGEKKQEVKHKTLGKGYIVDQQEDKITVEFYKTGKQMNFQYPNAFDAGFLQKLN